MKEVVWKIKAGYGIISSLLFAFCVAVLFSDFFTEPGSSYLVIMLFGFVLKAEMSHLEWYLACTEKIKGEG